MNGSARLLGRWLAAPAVSATLVLGCGGSSTPSAPSPSPAPATAATLSLSGSVRDDAGQPVAGASVAILDGVNANRAATTDTSGRYSISGLSGGGFTVRVRSDGYNDAMQGVTLSSSTTLDLTISRTTINLTGTLTGSYTSTDFRSRQRYTSPVMATVTQTGTSISGTFRIHVNANREDDWTGSFSGTISSVTPPAQYSGGLRLSALISTDSGRCNGARSSITGTASTTQLTLSAPGLWRWEECVDSQDDTVITLRR